MMPPDGRGREHLRWRPRPRVLHGPRYFFFLGFLTSFLGLRSFATLNPPLQKDYNRTSGRALPFACNIQPNSRAACSRESRTACGTSLPVPAHRIGANFKHAEIQDPRIVLR